MADANDGGLVVKPGRVRMYVLYADAELTDPVALIRARSADEAVAQYNQHAGHDPVAVALAANEAAFEDVHQVTLQALVELLGDIHRIFQAQEQVMLAQLAKSHPQRGLVHG